MFEETSKLNAVDTRTKFRDFIENTNVVDLCRKEYCRGILINKADLSSLENFRLGIALGDDLPSCQSECSALKANKEITKKEFSKCYSACHKEYNQKGNISGSNELKDCRTKCTKNKEVIKSAAEEYYKNKKEEMAQKVTDEELEEHKNYINSLIDEIYDKSIKEAEIQYQKSKSSAEKKKNDSQEELNSLTKEKFVETKNVDDKEMKRELLDKIEKVMSPKQEFLNLLVKENYVIDKVCKNDYCNKQAEKELSKCEDKKNHLNLSKDDYQKCKTNCQKEKESKKYECEGKCYLKQEDIKNAAEEYSQEIKNNTSKEKFDIGKIEQGFLDKVQEIMENTFPAELEYSIL